LGWKRRVERRKGIERERERERETARGANINATLQTADVAAITNLILSSQSVLPSLPRSLFK